jgi:hypothetical protein
MPVDVQLRLTEDRRVIVANYLATIRKPKSVANLLPIFYSQGFVCVRLQQPFFEGDKILRGRILVFKTGAINHSTIPPLQVSELIRYDSSKTVSLNH